VGKIRILALSFELSAFVLAGCATAAKPPSVTGLQEPWKEYRLTVAGRARLLPGVANNARTPAAAEKPVVTSVLLGMEGRSRAVQE